MEPPASSQIEPRYRPTKRQEDRAAQIRKFNRLYIYLPIGFASSIALGITVLLIILALGVGTPKILATISGMADSFVILAIIPTLVLCAIVPLAFFAITYQMRQRGSAPIRQTQWFLWRIQSRLDILGPRISAIMAKIRKPFVRVYSRYAFFQSLINYFRRLLRRG